MLNRTRNWLRAATAVAAAAVCVAGLVVGAQAASAAGTAQDCSGGTWAKPTMLASGTYDGLTVSGVCMVTPGATVTVNGPVTITVDTSTPPQGVLFAINSQTMTINGDVSVAAGAILALGCTAELGCDGTNNNPPSKDTVNGNITATSALAMYLNGDTVKGDVSFTDGGWGKTCTDPNADAKTDPLGHDLVVKDNTFVGSVTLTGWSGCWMGFIRNNVTGSVTITNNYANPDNINNPGTKDAVKQGLDSTEIITNVISGDLACSGNTPAAQVGDSHGSANLVHGSATGECANLSLATAAACTAAPFTDVTASDQFCGDIAWLNSEKITGGYSDGGYHPTAPVSRQAMAAFLYRMMNGGNTAPVCSTSPFSDVAASDKFCGAIEWLASQKISGGYSDGGYHPTAPVSRQAMAAFLYRMMNGGNTAPVCSTSPFSDVAASDKFCGAIEWLASQKISGGYSDGGYHPTAPVSRQAMAAFLYRMQNAGKNAPACSKSTFTDVPVSNDFCGAIAWLVSNRITGGYADGGFHPAAPVSRQAMAAFLYRVSALSKA